jgi:hypothetical protein
MFGAGRNWRVLVGICAASIFAAGGEKVAAGELFSESVFVPPVPTTYLGRPVTGWKDFNILFSGNPTLPTQDATDPNTDAFAVNGTSTITVGPYTPLATDAGSPVGPGLVTLPGLERLQFSGSVDINQANIPNQNLDNPPDQVQFGVVGPTDNTPMQILAQHWQGSDPDPAPGETDNYLSGVPVVSITPVPAPPAEPPAGESFDYIIDFVQFTQDGISGSEWAEFPYVPGEQPTFHYGGWADPVDFIYFTNNEIQLSTTEIPLDDLNFADDSPLPGGVTVGPAFTTTALSADVVPEPVSSGLLVIGLAGLASIRRRARGAIT